MKILYQIMSLSTIYAERTIYNGYKNAFEDLGHEFFTFNHTQDFRKVLEEINPDIFLTSLYPHYIKHIDIDLIDKKRRKGMIVFVSIPAWRPSPDMHRINESRGLSSSPEFVSIIKNKKLGDIYYNVFEKWDERMQGFVEKTKALFHTIPLAADKTLMEYASYDKKFESDISFIGTYHPAKKRIFEEYLFPLKKKYRLLLYGQDWTSIERVLGLTQRIGQYFSLPILDSIQKAKLKLTDEPRIYASSQISVNLHTSYQRQYGGDCNERAFKIPLYGGFEITDDVKCLHDYFIEGKEIIIAKNKKDWFDKIDYYIKNPEKRIQIIEAGRKRVLKDHTYHKRAELILDLYRRAK